MPLFAPSARPRRAAARLLVSASGVLALLVGCAEDGESSTTASALFPLDYATRYTEVRDCRGTSDHGLGAYIRVFASAEGSAAYSAGTYPLPVGTTLVKAVYVDAACTDLDTISAMKKRTSGGESSAAQWDWQETDAAGLPLASATSRCTSCHTGCKDRDMTCTDP